MNNIQIKKYNINEITNNQIIQLKKVFSKAYFHEHMYKDTIKDIQESPIIFKAFFAQHKNKIIGVIFIENKPHKFIEYNKFKPIHIKHFTVLPKYRSQGIGKKLLDEAKKYVFKELNLKVIFGESNELGSLSFYGKEKALYSLETIKNYSNRNNPKENIEFFKEFITNPKFKTYRYPEGNGIPFVFCNSNKEEKFFTNKSFISKTKLLKK